MASPVAKRLALSPAFYRWGAFQFLDEWDRAWPQKYSGGGMERWVSTGKPKIIQGKEQIQQNKLILHVKNYASKNTEWGKGSVFSKWCWENLDSYMQKEELDLLHFHIPKKKKNLKMD